MKKVNIDRMPSCPTPLEEGKGTETACPLKTPGHPISDGLLTAGVFSLLLHGLLIVVLVFGIPPDAKESPSPYYQVTIRPLQLLKEETHQKTIRSNLSRRSPVLPAKIETPRKGIAPVQKVDAREVIPPVREPDERAPDPVEAMAAPVPLEERKPLSPPQDKEDTIREPIPLPMSASSQPEIPSKLEPEDDPLVLSSSSHIEDDHENTTPGKGPGERTGAGSGSGGSGGMGDGTGGGRGDSDKGGEGITLGAGHGGPGIGSVAKGQGAGKGTPGPGRYGSGGSGKGDGSRQGGTGPGNSGKDGSGVPHPRYADNPKPVYPREARERRYEGEVVLRVEVLSNGRVGQIEVKRSSGYEMLDQSAFAAVKQWRFIPAMQGSVAIPFWVNIPIRFRLL